MVRYVILMELNLDKIAVTAWNEAVSS